MTKKKSTIYSVFAVIIALAVASCAASPAPAALEPSPLVELSRAIRDVSHHLNNNVPAGRMIAFVNVQSGSVDLSNFIIDDLIANAVTDRIFTVVDRQQLDHIRAEQNIQLSGEVDDNTALNIGRFSGAQTVVTGWISSLGGYFRLTVRALDVETAHVQGQYNRVIGTERAMAALIGTDGRQIAHAPAPQPVAAQTQALVQPEQVPAVVAPPTPIAPVVVTPEPVRLANGRRTFHPRPQAYQGARAVNAFVYYIVVRNEYMTINLHATPTESGAPQAQIFGFISDWRRILLQCLDRPDSSFTPVQGEVVGIWGGRMWVTFRNVTGTRFSLSCTANSPRVVFDEIRIGAPD